MNRAPRFFARIGAAVLASAIIAGAVAAQNNTATTVRHGETRYNTQVTNAEVVYVEGNDLVVRNGDGKIEHFVVPDSDRFTVNGRDISVGGLTPGTKLTQTITTSVTPRYVTTVQTIKGKVWHVSAPHSIYLRLPDNTTHVFKVPSNAKFIVHGQPKTVFDVRKGMSIEATVITDSEESVNSTSKSTIAELPAPEMPREVGVLLIMTPQSPLLAPVSSDEPTEMAQTLPKTASVLPLVGLLGAIAITFSLGLTTLRRRFNA